MTRRYDSQEVRRRTISAGIKLFIEKGYHKTTVSDICRLADVSNGSFFNVFRTKNGLLMELVVNMFNGQFDAADSLLPADSEPHMLYVFETAIQLAIAETSENLRDIYLEAYSHTEASEYIYQHTSSELYRIFGPYLPSYTESDFYELEIGSAGIMRGYMSRPCDKYFTLEKKLARFLSMSLNAYAVPAAEQKQVLDFIAKLDIRAIAVQVMQELFKALAMRFSFPLPDSVKA